MRVVRLLLLHALACAFGCVAVSVGDQDTAARELLSATCSNATTLALLNATATASSTNTDAQIITGGSCESVVVSATQVSSATTGGAFVVTLDVRKRGIQRVSGIPPSVQVLYVTSVFGCPV